MACSCKDKNKALTDVNIPTFEISVSGGPDVRVRTFSEALIITPSITRSFRGGRLFMLPQIEADALILANAPMEIVV